jgi:hypothetical protein
MPPTTGTAQPWSTSYVGEYQAAGKTLLISIRGTVLLADLTGARQAELVPESETDFAWFDRESNLEAQVTYKRTNDPGGWQAVITRDGREIFRGTLVPAK